MVSTVPESDVQQLAQALSEDADLKAAIEAATREDVVRIANEKGISVTLADLTRRDGELSESELEGASGGSTFIITLFWPCL